MIVYILSRKQLRGLGVEFPDGDEDEKFAIFAENENPGWPKNRICEGSVVTESGEKIDTASLTVDEMDALAAKEKRMF